MSLHTLANHLQTAGRGEDKVLVHMTPGEVNGLQSLAMAHGGSLSINPQTGLPEAGFLSGILPMLAGAALTVGTGGVINPLTASMLVGGAGAVATGSLSKGLMMGLGAYGGAGLGAGLMGGAAGAVGAGAAGLSTAVSPAVGAGQALTGAGLAGSPAAAAAAAPTVAASATPGLTNTLNGGFAPTIPTQVAPNPADILKAQQTASANYLQNNPIVASGGTQAPGSAPSVQSATSGFERIKSLPGKAFDLITGSGPDAEKAREEFYKQNKGALIAAGIGTLGASREDPRIPKEQRYTVNEYDWTRRYSPSSLAPGSSAERTYFAADGGLMGLPVEQMSQQNASSENTRYPMAFQKTPNYSISSERPIPQNVVYPATDTDTTPYSGAERGMATGGVVALAAGGKTEAQKEMAKLTADFNSFKTSQNKAIADAKAALTKRTAELTNKYNASKKAYDADTAAQTKEFTARINAEKNAAAKAALTKEFNTWKNGRTAEAGQFLKDFNAAKTTATNETNANVTKLNNDITSQQKELGSYNTYLTNLDKYKYSDVGDVAQGSNLTSISKNYNTEIGKQKQEMTNAGLALEAAKKTGVQSLIERAQQDYDTQKSQYESATTKKADALKSFGETTARGESISTKGISAIPIPKVEPGTEKMVPTESGWGEEKPTPQYQKLDYGKVTATTGWDSTTKKPYEPEDIQQVFQEVVGRKATDAEVAQYLGTPFNKGAPGTIKQLVDAVNKSPDIAIARGKINPFTEEELQANAQYYWGRKLTSGELKQFASANYADFGKLRDALTKSNQYVDNLNKLNESQFTKQNAPALPPANDAEIYTAYQNILGRYPTAAERDAFLASKTTVNDIQGQLKKSDEYRNKFVQPDQEQQTGDGTTGGGVDMYPRGGGKGYNTPVTYNKMTDADLAQWQKDYASTPSSPYKPTQTLTSPAQLAGALPYQDINKQLGLTGLYQQMAQKMPELQQGLKFDPTQGQAMASPFANVTPGLVTLQSAAVPQPYVPPTPVIPGSQVYSPAMTPEEQRLQSILQSQPKNMASGGISSYNLGGYSDGGRLLKGPGDGVSDSIPASIGDRQPARLADGEFVIPARIVSEIGNGSTDAGARKLYAMMQRIQQARGKTVGKNKVAVKSGADKMLPA